MRDCSNQISKFEAEEVRLTGDERKAMRARRDQNRSRLRKGLEAADKPKMIGMYSQGSYAMWTMVQDAALDYDIDDGVYFDAHALVGDRGAKMTPLNVRKMICDAVQDDRFTNKPEVLKNCVRVYYNEGFHVDLPAYRRFTTVDAWSGKNKFIYELASSEWEPSDPREVTKWFNKANSNQSPDFDESDGQLRRTVRLLKKFAKSRSSWKDKTATGFMITKLVQECFNSSKHRDDIAFRETSKAIANRLALNFSIAHPVLNQTITREEDNRPAFFRDRLKENLATLKKLDEPGCDHKEAMSVWDSFFSTDWFSQQTPDDDGGGGKGSSGPKGEPSAPVILGGSKRYANS